MMTALLAGVAAGLAHPPFGLIFGLLGFSLILLRLETIQDNPQYRFISDNAKSAVKKWGVKSVSLLAIKE